MVVDANLLLYAVDARAEHHDVAREWLTRQLLGPSRIGLPWQTLGAFIRIATHPRVPGERLTARQAWELVEAWLAAPAAWVPVPGERYGDVLGDLVKRHAVTGNLVPDAQLAALAIEHGVPVASADGDFARFSEVRWINPLDER